MKQKDNFELVINLRSAHNSKRTMKFKRAINEVKEEVARHFGANKVILDPLLVSAISNNSKDKLARKVRVVVLKIGEKTFLVRLAVKPE
ncbi:50S ribosomal protein L31e [Metallosphaera tengchongensis]|uniref:Large ribosomal subunit protein eL31 n=1 Tax=Metallosphaera tengchongensis TaxID=1532350 RepID=A0A6N0NUW5_9CREN|nr:50S ribosomal protein L31e [Metallosphaera tengchongensis]QKQ99277.1 50S ribosomal protein L31e [Metallosphaera tengchongensis]